MLTCGRCILWQLCSFRLDSAGYLVSRSWWGRHRCTIKHSLTKPDHFQLVGPLIRQTPAPFVFQMLVFPLLFLLESLFLCGRAEPQSSTIAILKDAARKWQKPPGW